MCVPCCAVRALNHFRSASKAVGDLMLLDPQELSEVGDTVSMVGVLDLRWQGISGRGVERQG